MKSLKFKVLGNGDKSKDFGLEMNFVGTPDEEKIASSLITHLMTGNLMIGIDFEDIRRFSGQKINKLFLYEFTPPFVPREFLETIKGMSAIIYGVYGESDLLDMHLFESIQRTILDNFQNSIGAPISPESIGAVIGENPKTIKIVALCN